MNSPRKRLGPISSLLYLVKYAADCILFALLIAIMMLLVIVRSPTRIAVRVPSFGPAKR